MPIPVVFNGKDPGSLVSRAQNPVREPFSAMDAGVIDTSTRWVHTGQHQAEAGFEDPSLGWVSVRAQADAHGVRAALIPNSSDAAQVLDSHLGGLNAHIASEHLNLNPVTISAPEMHWNGHTSGQDLNQNDRPGTNNGNQHQQEDQGSKANQEDFPHRSHASLNASTGVSSTPLPAMRSPGGHQVWVVA